VSTLTVKARRDIRRQRGQFVAIAITVLLGVALYAASYDAFRGLQASYERAYSGLRFADLTVTGGDTARIAAGASTAGAEAVRRRTVADLPIQVGEDKFLGRIVGLPAAGQPAVNRVEITAGSYLSAARADGVLLEQHMADTFHLSSGDSVIVNGAAGRQRVKALGVAASPEYFWPAPDRQNLLPPPKSFGVVFVPEPLAERLAGTRGPNQAAIYYPGGEPDSSLTRKLTAMADAAGASDVLTRADQPSNSALQSDVDSFRTLSILFPLLFLTAAGLAVSVLMRRLVTAQRPIIGMLRACGYSRGQIVGHYLFFGVSAGVAGSVLGAIGGVLLAGVVTHAYVTELLIPVTVVKVSPVTIAFGIGFGVAATLIASALPARSAARIPPAEAMRRFAPARAGHRSLVERLLPPLRSLPVRSLMVLRSIGRNRMRTLSTVLGVVLALCLILVSWGMIDTTQLTIDREFNEVQNQDAEVYFQPSLSAAALKRVKGVQGVAVAEPGAELPATLRSGDRLYQTELDGFTPGTSMHAFLTAGGGRTGLPASGILAGKALRGKLEVGAGDSIEMSLPGGRRASARLAGFVDEPFGTYAYATLDQVRAAAGPSLGDGNVALVRYQPGVDRDEMRRRLSALPGAVAFSDTRALYDQVNKYLGLYYAFIGIMLLFGGALAFALLFNAMTSNISERVVEVATLRAAGARHRTLARMITSENVLITLLGIGPGLVIGYELARLFMLQYTNDQFNFSLQMRTSTFVLAALAILIVALLSQLPGLRAVRRLDVAEVVRERAA
jgi:putative ABC transport system permease protein